MDERSHRFRASIESMLSWGEVASAALCCEYLCEIGVLPPEARAQLNLSADRLDKRTEASDGSRREPSLRLALRWVRERQCVAEALLLLTSLPGPLEQQRFDWMRALDALVSMPKHCPEALIPVYQSVGARELQRALEILRALTPAARTSWGDYLLETLTVLSQSQPNSRMAQDASKTTGQDATSNRASAQHASAPKQAGAQARSADHYSGSGASHGASPQAASPQNLAASQGGSPPPIDSSNPTAASPGPAAPAPQSDDEASRLVLARRLSSALSSRDFDHFYNEAIDGSVGRPDALRVVAAVETLRAELSVQLAELQPQSSTIPLSGRGAAAFQVRMLNLGSGRILYEALQAEQPELVAVERALFGLIRVLNGELFMGTSLHPDEPGHEEPTAAGSMFGAPESLPTSRHSEQAPAGNSLPPAPSPVKRLVRGDEFSDEVTRVADHGDLPLTVFDDEVTVGSHFRKS